VELKKTLKNPCFETWCFWGIYKKPQFPPQKDMIPNKPDLGSVCQSDDTVFGSMGSASTPVENIPKLGYF
jgi:hypothetical protein